MIRYPFGPLPKPSNGEVTPLQSTFQRFRNRREGPRSIWGTFWRYLVFAGITIIAIPLVGGASFVMLLMDPRRDLSPRDIELAMSRLSTVQMLQIAIVEFVFRGIIFVHSLRRIGLLPAYILSGLAATSVTFGVRDLPRIEQASNANYAYAFVFRMTRSIFSPILLHMWFDKVSGNFMLSNPLVSNVDIS